MIYMDNIYFSYGEKKILEDFSLYLPQDGIYCLMGPSGVGKTSLLRLIAGLSLPDKGKVENLPQKPAFLFQENRLLPHFTAFENVAAVLPKDRRDEAKNWLEIVGLLEEANTKPGALSGGMCRRVALARALAYGGDFLLLDEPFTGLDAQRKKEMADLIFGQNTPALVVTHSKEEVKLLQSRGLIEMKQAGKVEITEGNH